ncbi:MAG: polysaccharide biosynthesis/export family protein [Pseudomonadota bacterium]
MHRGLALLAIGAAAVVLAGCAANDGTITTGFPSKPVPVALAAPSTEQHALGLAARASSASGTPDQPSPAVTLAPSDLVEIVVFRVPELSRTARVEDDGAIQMPLIGRVPVAGQTPDAAATKIRERLGRDYLEDPKVTLLVRESQQRRITVDGAVKQPGVYDVASGTTLLQAIAMARGEAKTAKGRAVVTRQIDGRAQAVAFDVAAIRAGRSRDPRLKPGDRVHVPASEFKNAVDAIAKFVPFAHVLLLL